MRFSFSPEEETFRQELLCFLEDEVPRKWPLPSGVYEPFDQAWEISRPIVRKLGEKGWLAIGWPREYGGQGASFTKQVILNEEMCYHEVPGVDRLGVAIVGPTIMTLGTVEQKERHLLPIARGEIAWCQGFSEPAAGSDLASLQTRAIRDGEAFIINGQKIWTSGAHRADWCFLLTRTDTQAPKHRGITAFLVDMRTPGITVSPLINMAGEHNFNQVFFENVRVPEENVVGVVNQGWKVINTLLRYERSSVHRLAWARRLTDDLVAYARSKGVTPVVQNRLVERVIEGQVGRLLAYRVAWMQDRGLEPMHEASMSRMFGAEYQQRVSRTGMELLGLHGQLARGDRWARLAGKVVYSYLSSVGGTFGAGTSEIQRTVIAIRGLGLPQGAQ